MNGPVASGLRKLRCPYDESHLIEAYRLQVHLVRCRQNFKHVEFIACPLNVTHRVKSVEIERHLGICPDRKKFDTFKYTVAPLKTLVPTPVVDVPKVEAAENWDKDPDVAPYDPTTYAENAQVLRLCQNAPPLERKVFRKAEHLRLKKMDDN